MALKPPIHGRDHCPGGADPIPCLSLVTIGTSWEADTTGLITANTWQSVGGVGFWNDGYVTPGGSASVDLGACEITMPTKTLVHIHAYIQFLDSFASGNVVAVAISGTWGRITNAVTVDATGVPGLEKIAVSAGVWHPTTPLTFGLHVFHTNAASRTLGSAQMTASSEAPLLTTGWQV